ncbi:hypothetical protein SAMN04515671_1353 [Nakamurella panacisegetis]|uniref:Tetratricopeptide repeat-containing protein n=2 Tax=Nakamurella panacisegetis TaxID=1090615 RepID=A0A1H0KLM6_9ACTN|nr:hypothetical protein SAMN04515671_1353 [Nakamurella panacisegetis]
MMYVGETAQGFALWHRVAASTQSPLRDMARGNIGEQLIRLTNDVDAARPLLEAAVGEFKKGDALSGPRAVAAASLGHVRAAAGQLASANELWAAAIASGDRPAVAMAQVYQARQALAEGRVPLASSLLKQAMMDSPAEVRSDAEGLLASLPPVAE